MLQRGDYGGEIFFAVACGYSFFEIGDGWSCGVHGHAMAFAFFAGVSEILGHQAKNEIRREVVRGGARGENFHERTAGGSGGEDGYGFFAVEAAGSEQGQGFGERGGLDSAEKIVDELQGCAAANGAEMQDFAAHNGEHGAHGSETFGGTSDEKKQFAGCGLRLRA